MHTSFRIEQALRFCTAGIFGVSAYYAALYGLTEYFGVWYIASATIGFILNTGISFTLQKFWTFKNKKTETIRKQIMLYVVMKVSLLITNTTLLYCMVEYLHMWYISAQIILTTAETVADFIVSRKILTEKSVAQQSLAN